MAYDTVEKCTAPSEGNGDWNILYWILGTICMPVAVPLVLINLWRRSLVAKQRKCLPGKVVLITGASSGLGEALAHVFYKAGCKVILAARRLNELERVKKDLMALEVVGTAYPPTVMSLDLAELNAIPKFANDAIAIHNGIDILINNGGISVRAEAISTALDVDLKVMTVNYFGTVALTKAVLPSMVKKQTGHICFISSVQGKIALPYRSAYSASKHALQAFSDSLRAEVASKRLKVTCFSPGYIKTQLSVNALTASGQKHGKMDKATSKGMSAEECAASILKSLLGNEKDVIISDLQAKVGFWLRFICPPLYFWIMEKRALSTVKEE
ncbi:dehydrogenase/reductase SDR family protein 7-like [Musca domestica]|uniref:Dehydrogenase/reductase SDR family protein 7-like n=1 Tax=Musca domestica TaxID=7370 RepID=A0A9J7I0I9_MUSDO|nr:dehydrogenase/reductase SDR family protein 7-like [Musca domestica]